MIKRLSKIFTFRIPLRTWCALWVFIFCSFHGKPEMDADTAKSLFIYNFTKHVNWPVLQEQKLVIGVMGDAAFAGKLKTMIAGKRVSEKEIEVRAVEMSGISGCQLLFVTHRESSQLKKIMSAIEGQSILVVTEEPGLALKGSCINIIEIDEKMKFEINEKNIMLAGLKVSNQLLSLGILVKNNTP